MAIKVSNDIKNQGGLPAQLEGLDVNKPAPGQTGRLYWATDTGSVYRDTGSAWVVFIQNFAGTGFVTLDTSQTITGTKAFYNQQQFNNYIQLKKNAGFTITPGFSSIGAGVTTNVMEWYDGDNGRSNLLTFNTGANTAVTFPSGNYTVATQAGLATLVPYTGATADLVLGNHNLRVGPLPGNTYLVEFDGGVNLGVGHTYRINTTPLVAQTANRILKSDGITAVNSLLTDTGTAVTNSGQTILNGIVTINNSLNMGSGQTIGVDTLFNSAGNGMVNSYYGMSAVQSPTTPTTAGWVDLPTIDLNTVTLSTIFPNVTFNARGVVLAMEIGIWNAGLTQGTVMEVSGVRNNGTTWNVMTGNIATVGGSPFAPTFNFGGTSAAPTLSVSGVGFTKVSLRIRVFTRA